MPVLEVSNLKFGYENEDLYSSISFSLNHKEHAVLVGPNGIGKSTFLKLIVKKLSPDSGKITWENNISYAYLDQQLEVEKDMSINQYLYGVYANLFELEEKLNQLYIEISTSNDVDKLLDRAESMREYLESNNFYNIETEINNVIVGLGLKTIDFNRTLKTLSGGEKAKVYLAKLLLEKPDCILMDEPTNFLDKNHIEWLIEYLNSFQGTFLIISHDQYFLSKIAKVVYAFENKKLNKYKGNYEYYLNERELRIDIQEKEYKKQQEYIKKLETYIQKNITRASTTKMAQSRRKRLEKLERIDKPKEQYEPHILFPYSKDMGQKALELVNLEVGYDHAILEPINFLLKKNERIEIIGKNGIGKSTFIKTILGIIEPINGSFKFNPSIEINYFSQEEDFDYSKTAIDYIRYRYPMMEIGKVMSTLGALGIKGDLARKPLFELSGGELCRVRLSLLTLKKSNFLIMDEPTNHLDAVTKEELHEAIAEFPGCVIIVSHEKGFAEDLVDYTIKF